MQKEGAVKIRLPVNLASEIHWLMLAAENTRKVGRILAKAKTEAKKRELLANLSKSEVNRLAWDLPRIGNFLLNFLGQLPCASEVEVEEPK